MKTYLLFAVLAGTLLAAMAFAQEPFEEEGAEQKAAGEQKASGRCRKVRPWSNVFASGCLQHRQYPRCGLDLSGYTQAKCRLRIVDSHRTFDGAFRGTCVCRCPAWRQSANIVISRQSNIE